MAVQSQRSLKFWVCHQNYAVLKKNKYAHKKKNQAKSSWEKFLNPILKILFFDASNFPKQKLHIWYDFEQQ